MATAAQIQAAIADAVANDVPFEEMAALVKRALINAMINNAGDIEIPWQAVASDGTSNARMPIDAAQRLLDFCLQRANGGIIAQYVEFPEYRR